MFELKIASSKFVQTALEAGREANFEGAVLLLARGLSVPYQKELMTLWRDLDDITYNDILVLTFGMPIGDKRRYGINNNISIAHSLSNTSIITDTGDHVVADDVSVAYPSSRLFSSNFGQLLKVANYIPYVSNDSHDSHDSHGTTDIRRALGLMEQQLPAFLITSYRQNVEYVVELGLYEMQLSPAMFVHALTQNLNDLPYRYRRLEDEAKNKATNLEKLRLQLIKQQRILENLEKLNKFDKFEMLGQLEVVISHMNQTLVDAPDDLKDMGDRVIRFLSGEDEEIERIKYYESNLIEYALSQDTSSVAGQLPRKLRQALDRRLRNLPLATASELHMSSEDRENKRRKIELKISRIEEKITTLQTDQDSLYQKRTALNIETAFVVAVEKTLKQFGLKLRSQDNQRNTQQPYMFRDSLRRTYSFKKVLEETSREKNVASTKETHPLKIFYCYAHEDKDLRDRIGKHLSVLMRLGRVVGWYDREIQAGTDWEREIEGNLSTANIILLLVSADFVASDYCYGVEMKKALELHRTGQACVLPILLRPVDWQGALFATLQMLPTEAKPITQWQDQDEALEDVAKGIRNIVNSLLSQKG